MTADDSENLATLAEIVDAEWLEQIRAALLHLVGGELWILGADATVLSGPVPSACRRSAACALLHPTPGGSARCGCGRELIGEPLHLQERAVGRVVWLKGGAQPQLTTMGARVALAAAFETVVQAGFARHITSQVHIAAIQDAYHELQEKNQGLAASVEQLRELDAVRRGFLATFSHELRTPLTSVIGYSEMLLEGLAGTLQDEQREHVQTIMNKGRQLLEVINEILDMAKVERAGVVLRYGSVELASVVENAAAALLPHARSKAIDVVIGDVPEPLRTIFADDGKLTQVFINLLGNAVKFTPERGEIRFSFAMAPAHVSDRAAAQIRIRDTGVGIPEDARERVFEPFYQVAGGASRPYGGTGLGLSLVRKFVQAHGGQISVEASGPAGTTFLVQLPVDPRDSPSPK